MVSPACEQATLDAISTGRALLKFISANDAGLTGSHQCGFYLPKGAWRMFSPHPPEPVTGSDNPKHEVRVLWQDGRVTESVVTWYGRRTRSEYRLTRFGPEFPFLDEDSVGNLLVLVPESLERFKAFVLDNDEDIEELQAALGVEVVESWGVYEEGREYEETEEDCVERHFREFAAALEEFPLGEQFSKKTRQALFDCVAGFRTLPPDRILIRSVDAEYRLFRMVERRLCEPLICRLFESVDDFLKTAATIMNRRKTRAGRALENHVEYLLQDSGIPFDVRPHDVDGKPDIVIPGAAAYHDTSWPDDKLFIVGVKTTCKDRWRQVTREGTRIAHKHLLTLQKGISSNQLREIGTSNVSLIVPEPLHRDYRPDDRPGLISVTSFISQVRKRLSA